VWILAVTIFSRSCQNLLSAAAAGQAVPGAAEAALQGRGVSTRQLRLRRTHMFNSCSSRWIMEALPSMCLARMYSATTTSAADLRKLQAAHAFNRFWLLRRGTAPVLTFPCSSACAAVGLCCACAALQVPGCAAEFYSYGVLHAAALGPLLLNQELGQLPRAQLEHPAIVHALATARAVRWVAVRCAVLWLSV
jgi:hypothetical protein